MIWTIIAAILAILIGCWAGFKKFLFIDQIRIRAFLFLTSIVLLVFLVLRFMHANGFFPEAIAGGFMAVLYSLIAGFLFGSAYWQYRHKSKMGGLEYFNRSFVTEIFPNLIALTLIIAGIARSAVLGAQAVTPIRVGSGLSLAALGILGLTIRLIPEFRRKGFVLLDRTIPWSDFISYRWAEENVLELEFEYKTILKVYRTIIPLDDRKKVEVILNKKLVEKLENKKP